MEEPHLETAIEETESDKTNISDVFQSLADNDLEKQMDVDEAFSSSAIDQTALEGTSFAKDTPQNEETDEQEAVPEPTEDISMSFTNENESMEQVNFDKTAEETFDDTIQTDVDYTEASINISQLNVEQNDDSNDAFNELKRAETDALHDTHAEAQFNEESEDKTEQPSDSAEQTTRDDDETVPTTDTQESAPISKPQTDSPKATETPMESEDLTEKDTEIIDNDINAEDATTETQPADGDDVESTTQTEDITGEPEEEETETTNEGEGVDENVCLFGDAERELTDADKERVVQPQEISEEDDGGDKDAATTDAETADEVMEIDSEQPEKDTEPDEEIVEAEPEIEESVDQTVPLKENEIRELTGELSEETCLNCENTTNCQYKLLEDNGEIKYLCSYNCVKEHRDDNPDKYTLTQKKVYIYEIAPSENLCSKCNETKSCKYHYRITITTSTTKEPPAPVEVAEGEEQPEPAQPIIETVQSTENKHLCEDACLQEFIGGNTEKYVVKEIQRRSMRVREMPKRLQAQEEQEVPKIVARTDAEVEAARIDRDQSFIRRCALCYHVIAFSSKSISWEAMDFCDEKCLGQYQNLTGSTCARCSEPVSLTAMGKLCVRFGFEVKQFCNTQCLDEFKKTLKACALCQKDLSNEEDVVLAQVGEKRVYRDFCNQQCLKRYELILNPKKKQPPFVCSVCNNKKPAKIEVLIDDNVHRFCSNPCFSAFKFVNNVAPDQCDVCTRYFERKLNDAHTIYQGSESKIFCTKICMNMYICKSRDIWQCNWCKVNKYNYDMMQINFGNTRMCSLNCLSLYEVSLNALTRKRTKCAHCKLLKQPQYHLTMSDTSIRHFCTYQCAIGFQAQFSKAKLAGETPEVVPAGTAKRIKPSSLAIEQAKLAPPPVPIIARVQSLSTGRRGRPSNRPRSPIPVPELTVQLERLSDLPSRVKVSSLAGSSSWTPIPSTSRPSTPVRVEHKTQVVTIPPLPTQVSNKSTMCKAITLNKAISAVPATAEAECQTEDFLEKRIILPLPLPIYVPQPMYMYNMPTPIPVPFPLPIPVPVFIPTTRNSTQGIMKEIKKIQDKMPTDPYEAELLMMAEMVAGDRKREETDSDSDENNEIEYGDGIENNTSFNEDLVQMAFKMASGNDFDDPPVDLENEMTANTISQNAHGYGDEMDPQALHHHQLLLLQQQREAVMQANRGRKRMQPVKQNNSRNNTPPNKRIKREMEVMQPEMPREPAEKPDANMCLKYTFGVNAWKQWVATKNADLEKSSIRRKPIKSEILQLTADELNYSLCMFVKEVRKPNGSEYAPDTIYYLVLGIQQYLYENGRIDNIFTDRYYEQFTDCLDEVAKKFSVLYNDSQYIVTRVEEEHLWECKQLGAHSPHVLLSTLMFFNTKHFNLVTVDEHMELSFSHIMKHWKRNPNQPGAAKLPGSRNVLLRFYPPQSSLEANSRKKKVYEQQENEENPLRCPVKLYEFYLSKCPESVKTRNDVFYLQPERSCVPDSPVWYSTQPLSREALSKMLHRVKMVKEINIALLTS